MGAPQREPDTLLDITSTLARLSTISAFTEHPSDTMMAPTERAPSTAPPPAPPSTNAARYETCGMLGEGGMGRVEHVRDRDLLRDVAVKSLLPEHLANERLLKQFLWEARVTAYLDHPNIVPVHDLGVTPQGQVFFTMKLVKGKTLEAELDSLREQGDEAARSGLQRRLRMFLPLCNAVAFAHSRGVLHRDLKPANVMLGEFGEVLVSDWGIAVPLPGAAGDVLREIMPAGAGVGESAGTPMYMSPEQVRGEPLDARSDLYTLGVILYEMVALRPAFDAKTVALILKKVTEGDFPPLRTVMPGTSSAIEAVVAKALALDPAARYASVKQLAADIEILLDGRTPDAEAAPLVKQLARYYMARDPAIAQLRVGDIDLWMIACHFFGAGLFLLMTALIPVPWYFFWALLVCGVLVGIAPTLRWRRFRREAAATK